MCNAIKKLPSVLTPRHQRIKNKYLSWIRINERQQTGRWHFHLVIVCKDDIRRGLRFDELKIVTIKSANTALRDHGVLA